MHCILWLLHSYAFMQTQNAHDIIFVGNLPLTSSTHHVLRWDFRLNLLSGTRSDHLAETEISDHIWPKSCIANVMEVCKRVLKIQVSLALRPISYKMCAPLTDMCALCSSLRVPERRLMRDLHRYTDHQLIGLFFSDSTHSTASFFMTFPSIVGFYILVFLSSCRPRGWFFPYHKDPNSIFAVTLSESTVIWGQWPVAPLDSDRFSIKALCCFFFISTMSLNEFPPPIESSRQTLDWWPHWNRGIAPWTSPPLAKFPDSQS